MEIRLELADETQLPVIVGLLDQAANWLHQVKGSDQWPRPHPAPQERHARLMEGLRSGHTWIRWDGDVPVATITAEGTGDPRLWTEEDLAQPATYVHRLVVARRHAGQGVGAVLLDWAGARAVRHYGAKWIRVDLWTTNKALHTYYEGQGFEFVRNCPDPANPSGAMFQKSTSKIEVSRCVVSSS